MAPSPYLLVVALGSSLKGRETTMTVWVLLGAYDLGPTGFVGVYSSYANAELVAERNRFERYFIHEEQIDRFIGD